ncbi:MAG: hypothetical protein OXI52_11455, partial [Caldilineaceae bacterium]|nr:hypothetical protein [Caldilineaceae bacterium]
ARPPAGWLSRANRGNEPPNSRTAGRSWRIAELHNGSSLFTGDAGRGESNIRRRINENDPHVRGLGCNRYADELKDIEACPDDGTAENGG